MTMHPVGVYMRPMTILAAALLAPAAAAQHSILFTMDADEFMLDVANGAISAGTLSPDEVGIVTPLVGAYSASAFLSIEGQWAFIGDLDMDGRLVDASSDGPGADTDAIFVKRATGAPTGPVGQRDVFVSKEDVAGFASNVDSDVFRYAAQGVIEVFLSETQLQDAFGAATNVDLDALAQSDTGDLFFSVSDFSPPLGGDGSILHIPASAITYDGSGNVTAITPGSAIEIATEADLSAFIIASGMLTSVGGAPTTSLELSGLEIDPAGGTWTSPVDALDYPNLLFVWDGFSNDGGILSTAGGGSIASLNGVPLASSVATTGVQIGLLPDSTGLGGFGGLAVIDQIPDPLVLENYPTNLITSSTILYTEQQISGATPGGGVFIFYDIGPSAIGSVLSSTTLGGPSGEVFFGTGQFGVLGAVIADGDGHGAFVQTLPTSLVGSAANLVFQVYDLSSNSFGAPAPLQFL